MSGSLGELEYLLLLALLRRGSEASGVDLREDLRTRAGRDVLPGAVYTIMERMVAKGQVSSFTGEGTPARGGRRRKFYRLEAGGERALAAAYHEVRSMTEGLEQQLRRLARAQP